MRSNCCFSLLLVFVGKVCSFSSKVTYSSFSSSTTAQGGPWPPSRVSASLHGCEQSFSSFYIQLLLYLLLPGLAILIRSSSWSASSGLEHIYLFSWIIITQTHNMSCASQSAELYKFNHFFFLEKLREFPAGPTVPVTSLILGVQKSYVKSSFKTHLQCSSSCFFITQVSAPYVSTDLIIVLHSSSLIFIFIILDFS